LTADPHVEASAKLAAASIDSENTANHARLASLYTEIRFGRVSGSPPRVWIASICVYRRLGSELSPLGETAQATGVAVPDHAHLSPKVETPAEVALALPRGDLRGGAGRADHEV